ncbi:MAG: hypothetical protein WD874_01690, partial [Parcubacteria group bacterium]
MNQWSLRRRRIVLFIVLTTLIILVGVPMFFFVYKAPTCADGVMNGDESGVDCGGSCESLCRAESLPIVLKGDPRVLRVATSTYVAVAYAENPNVSGEVYRAGYTFKIFDATSTVPVKVISGSTYIPANSSIAIFEGTFNIVETVPERAIFEWDKDLEWKRVSTRASRVEVTYDGLILASTTPRLDASAENLTPENISNIDLVALIFDETGTIIGASKTFINDLPRGGKEAVVFTWPEPFLGSPVSIEIVQRILPDRSFIK